MLFPHKRKYIGIGQNESKNIGISDIGKNTISCIPSIWPQNDLKKRCLKSDFVVLKLNDYNLNSSDEGL